MLTIYFKELKDAIRDSKTLMLSVLVPVAMIVGIIFFYENMIVKDVGKTYDIGVEHTIEAAALDWLNSMESIVVHQSEDPVLAAEKGEVRAALLFTSDFEKQLQAGQTIGVAIHADQTSQKSSEAVDILLREIERKQSDIVEQRLNRMGIEIEQIKPFETVVHSLHAGNETSLMMVSMLLSMVIMFSVMLGGFPIAIDMFAGEKERKTMEALLITPVSRMKLITAKWLAISTFSAAGGVFAILAFITATSLFTENLAAALDFGSQPVMLAVSALICILFFSMLFAAIQAMVSIYANNFKEAQNYLTPVMFIGMIPYFMLIGVSPNELTTVDFVIPFLNIYAFLKELIYGIFHIQSLILVVVSTFVFIAICFAAASWMFKKDKWVLGK